MSNYDNLDISKYVVAAMCGCWAWESNVNPGVWESLVVSTFDHQYQFDNIGGFGLGQWTNVGTPYGRLWNLHTYVTAQGYADGDGDGQLEFIPYEDYWTTSSQALLGYSTLTEFLTSTSTDLDSLVWDFLACWEGVAGDHYDERKAYASTFLTYINDHMNDGNTYTWISSNNYLSETQMCNNVMVVFNYISGKRFKFWLLWGIKNNNERGLHYFDKH